MSPRRHVVSLYHAFEGLIYAFSSQPNFTVHLILSFAVIISAVIIGISQLEWLILVFTVCLGLVIELINTSIESVVDLVTQEWKISAKRAKDTAAAAMLLYAVGAIIIAIIIFAPKIWRFT